MSKSKIRTHTDSRLKFAPFRQTALFERQRVPDGGLVRAIALCEYNKPRSECGRLAHIHSVLLQTRSSRPPSSTLSANRA